MPSQILLATHETIELMRRQRHTQGHIAATLGMPDETKESAVLCLLRTVAYFDRLGVRIDRAMTDNGSCYRSKAFARACRTLGIRHITAKPYTPQTNGKAERFIQTALREWAYATAFETLEQRQAELPAWLHRYNWHRRTALLASSPPSAASPSTGSTSCNFTPSPDRSQADPRLGCSRWIANGENVLLLGPPGVGKTHLATALGREAATVIT